MIILILVCEAEMSYMCPCVPNLRRSHSNPLASNVYQNFCGVSAMRDQEREVVREVAAESNTESEVTGMSRTATTHRRGQSGGEDSGGL